MARPEPLFPGPECEPRADLPNLEKIKKPGILTTLSSVGSAGIAKYLNAGIFPIAGQEPLTEMQRKAEMFEFAYLLEQAAAASKSSTQRLLLVTAFNIVGWTGCCLRTEFKATRPVDYETFDFVSAELGFSFLTEFVKLHEDDRFISNCQAFGRGWSMTLESCSTFKLATASIYFNGNYAAELTFDDGDVYILSMPAGYASGIATGSPVFAYHGKATVEHRSTNRGTEVDLSEPGIMSGGKKHRVRGYIVEGGQPTEDVKIQGTWDGKIVAVFKDWKEEALVDYKTSGTPTQNKYRMPHMAVQLNVMTEGLERVLPPTDSRRRLDIRALEAGQFEAADEERTKLLELRNDIRASGTGKPKWFSPRREAIKAGPDNKLLQYKYDGGYWETRAAAARVGPSAWKDCSNIFGAV